MKGEEKSRDKGQDGRRHPEAAEEKLARASLDGWRPAPTQTGDFFLDSHNDAH
jgi:hypothetical protein